MPLARGGEVGAIGQHSLSEFDGAGGGVGGAPTCPGSGAHEKVGSLKMAPSLSAVSLVPREQSVLNK